MSHKLLQWMNKATTEEREALANGADTTRAAIYQITSGKRQVGPAKARLFERAAAVLRRKNPELPKLLRADLCPACAQCEYAKRCAKP